MGSFLGGREMTFPIPRLSRGLWLAIVATLAAGCLATTGPAPKSASEASQASHTSRCSASSISVGVSYSPDHKQLMVSLTNSGSDTCYLSRRFAAILQGASARNIAVLDANGLNYKAGIAPPGTVTPLPGANQFPAGERFASAGKLLTSFSPQQLKQYKMDLNYYLPNAGETLFTPGQSAYITFGVGLCFNYQLLRCLIPKPTAEQRQCAANASTSGFGSYRLAIEFFYGRRELVEDLWAPVVTPKVPETITDGFAQTGYLTRAPQLAVFTQPGVLDPITDATSYCSGATVAESALSAQPWAPLGRLESDVFVMPGSPAEPGSPTATTHRIYPGRGRS
jgi:hypothetical protein